MSSEGIGRKNEPGGPEFGIEQLMAAVLEGFLEVQGTLEQTRNKFMSIAEEHKYDEFKKDVADAIVGINFTVYQMFVDLHDVYRATFFDKERLKLAYEIIEMLVPYIAHNDQSQEQEIRKRIEDRFTTLETRLARVRDYPNRTYKRSPK